MAKNIAARSPRSLTNVFEGQEKEDFWAVLGGKEEYASGKVLQVSCLGGRMHFIHKKKSFIIKSNLKHLVLKCPWDSVVDLWAVCKNLNQYSPFVSINERLKLQYWNMITIISLLVV